MSVKVGLSITMAAMAAISCGQASIRALDGIVGSPTRATGIQADGSTVVGTAYNLHFADIALRWQGGNASRVDNRPSSFTGANMISGDGSTIVGRDIGGFREGTSAVGWRNGVAHYLSGQWDQGASDATHVSYDGSVIAGTTRVLGPDFDIFQDSYSPFLWREGFGARYVDLAADESASTIGLSSDGLKLFYGLHNQNRIFAWTEDRGPQFLTTFNNCFGITPTGETLFGGHGEPFGPSRPARWTAAHGFDFLPMLPGHLWGDVHASNADGSIMLGLSFGPDYRQKIFYWSALTGTVEFETFLRQKGAALGGFVLTRPKAMSWDGNVIVGDGTYLGVTQPWLVSVPEPCSLLVVFSALAYLGLRRASHQG